MDEVKIGALFLLVAFSLLVFSHIRHGSKIKRFSDERLTARSVRATSSKAGNGGTDDKDV
jgi:hypothetical protein